MYTYCAVDYFRVGEVGLYGNNFWRLCIDAINIKQQKVCIDKSLLYGDALIRYVPGLGSKH